VSRYDIRPMTRSEVELAVEWAAREGWNPGLSDAECFYAADPNGFFVETLNDEPVGAISAVSYGGRFGFVGLFIVRPENRGLRAGINLANKAKEYLAGQNIGLDGVLARVQNYEHLGFKLAYRNIRFETSGLGHGRLVPSVVPVAQVPLADVLRHDDQMFPCPRHAFIRKWIEQPGHTALAVMNKDKLAGYAVLRPCRVGHKIGPLFADSPALAETLLDAVLGQAPAGAPVYLDAPELNTAAMSMASRRQMRQVFATARMYNLRQPPLPLDRIFGVTTFELG